jgi:hypothetical protein
VTLRVWTAALLLVSGVAAAAQGQVTVRLEDPGSGRGPTLLMRALAGPHILIEPGPTRAVLPRDTVYRETVIVLGREAAVDGTVRGDVIVVGGDLHLHPRSVVTGRAVAFGGGVYESALSSVGSTLAFRDFTYDVTPLATGGYALRYRSFVERPLAPVTWPDFYGVRIPRYDRTNGLTLTGGPLVAPPSTSLLLEPTVSYRSQLGVVDPGFGISVGTRTTVQARVERGTFSNEDWIWPDYLNSAATVLIGHDTRNHYRANRGQASVSRFWRWSESEIEPYFGARLERAESVRPDSFAQGGPWSFSGRQGRDDMLRPNPPISNGSIFSGLAGIRMQWYPESFSASLGVDLEGGGFERRGNDSLTASPSFVQTTISGLVQFPTFGTQSLRLETHAVFSLADSTPRQRWAYVGGSGSIETLALLERGGDQLFYFDGRYNIPIEPIQLPLLGPPVFTIREVLAGADVRRFPSLAQAVGARLSAGPFYVQFLVDPAARHGHFGVGLSSR